MRKVPQRAGGRWKAGGPTVSRIPPEPRAQRAASPMEGASPSKQSRSPAVTGARIVGYAGMGG